MEQKTRDRLARRQMHGYEEVHILDTSVIIGAIKATVDRKRQLYG